MYLFSIHIDWLNTILRIWELKIFVKIAFVNLEVVDSNCFVLLIRHFGIAVVRRFLKMGPKMVERRLKTVRRLLHPLLVEMCAMLKNDDAYFPFLLFYIILLLF